jgi:predicted 3-demethylubiquinone-9 3-methyltransferase (glyoxalase superfamily)
MKMQKITPFLWFDDNAEQAINFYISVFPNSKITRVIRYGEAGPLPEGTVMTIDFELHGHPFTALNGGPHFKFNEAVSFSINCESQEEVDMYWKKLTEGGQEQPCGWLRDPFGLSWQVNPIVLGDMLNDPNPEKSRRVMEAMLKMKKIDIKTLKNAYNNN